MNARRDPRHRPILILTLAASLPVLWGLGRPYLWADEGDTAVFARNILRFGLPRAWDGTAFIEGDFGARLNADLVMVGTPWLPYYACAASFGIFGESARSARLPFASAALACLPALYFLILGATRDRRAALLAAVLLAASPDFLLRAREARYPSLVMLLSLLSFLAFLHLRRRRAPATFALCWGALFNCHPIPAAAVLCTCLTAAWTDPAWRDRRERFLPAAAAGLALALPWLLASMGGPWTPHLRLPMHPLESLARVLQFAIEFSCAAPLAGWAALAALNRRRLGSALGPPDETYSEVPGRRGLAMLLGLHLLFSLGGVCLTQTAGILYGIGMRYTADLVALSAAMTGLLLSPAAASRPAAALLVLLFAGTHLPGNALPWLAPGPPGFLFHEPDSVLMHKPELWKDRLLRTDLFYFLRGLFRHEPGTLENIARYLDANARPGDILVTNYSWASLYFHTGLPQGAKILPSYPVRAAARARGLPEHVFGLSGARWLVWRHPWEGHGGLFLRDVAARLRLLGARLVFAAEFTEHRWERRANKHFKRWAGRGYLYAEGEPDSPDAVVYRVEWHP